MNSNKPNLPNKKINTVVISNINNEIVHNIQSYGIKTIFTDKISNFLPFEQTHADMQFLPINSTTVAILDTAYNLIENTQKLYKTFLKFSLSKNIAYPNNVILNHTILNNNVICLKKSVPTELLKIFDDNHFTIIDTKQGYSKCSVCVVSNNAIITSDDSIYNSCIKNKIDVLKISKGQIVLEGTNYGFIGGCSGKLDKDCLAFTGNIKLHSDYADIKAFCNNYGVNLLSLSNNQLIDIGSIIPVV